MTTSSPRRRLSRISIAASLVASLLVTAPVASAGDPAPQSPNLFGVSRSWSSYQAQLDDWKSETGAYPELYQNFWTLDMDMSGTWIYNNLDGMHDRQTVPFIEITPSTIQTGTPLSQLLNGSFDDELDTLVGLIKTWLDDDPDHKVLIAPLPESNVSHHPWSDGPANFITGYNRIRDAFVNAGIQPSQIRFVFWVNGISSGHPDDYAPWYPGDDKVDVIGFSKINRGGNDWRDYDNVFTTHIEQMQAQIGPHKPILIAQTGTVDPKSGWLTDMMTRLPGEDQVIGAVYFNTSDFRIHPDGGSIHSAVKNNLDEWAPGGEGDWIFDGSMDAWVQWRIDHLPERLWGSNRYATGVAISQETHPAGAGTVYLAVGTNYPDAIAAGPLAAANNAPILLTASTVLPTPTADELVRLDPDTVILLGGEAAIGPEIVTAVQAAVPSVTVERIGGTNRYDTARLISVATFPDPVSNPIDTLFIVTGQNFPDALSAAATAVVEGYAMLTVPPGSLPQVIAEEIERLDPDRIVVLGGTAAVSPTVFDALKAIVADTSRVAASNRYALSAVLSNTYFTSPVENVLIAVGENFPDALAGGPAAAVFPGPLLLVGPDSIPDDVAAELARLRPANVIILGGSSVVSVGVQSQLADYVVAP